MRGAAGPAGPIDFAATVPVGPVETSRPPAGAPSGESGVTTSIRTVPSCLARRHLR